MKCSSCKNKYYCSQECQRSDWKQHKIVCKRISAKGAVKTPISSSSGKCPYKPSSGGIGAPVGVCPYRDVAEESKVAERVRSLIASGVDGMHELACLAQSGMMAIEVPIQDAFVEVLRMAENHEVAVTSEESIEYLIEMGSFLCNMIQWTENRDLIISYFDRLSALCIKFMAHTNASTNLSASIVFTTMHMRLYLTNRDLYFERLTGAGPDKVDRMKINFAVVNDSASWREKGLKFAETTEKIVQVLSS